MPRRRMPRGVTSTFAVQDIGTSGWTVNQWATANNGTYAYNHASQPGSRFYYIDTSQVGTELTIDNAADFYLWNGSAIIDSSGSTTGAGAVAYGTDILNPTGPIKPYRRWAHCGPRNSGGDVGAAQDVGRQNPGGMIRDDGTFNDGWFFKRGTEHSFDDDMISWRADKGLGAMPSCGVMTPRGVSAARRMMVGAYGTLTDARPIIKDPCGAFVKRLTATWNNVLYQDIHFKALDRSYTNVSLGYAGVVVLNTASSTDDIRIEGCWIQGCYDAVQFGSSIPAEHPGKMSLFRTMVSDAWNLTGNVSGIYSSGTDAGRLEIMDCAWIRNGFLVDPTIQATDWPDTAVGNWTYVVRNRNWYISGEADPMNSELSGNLLIKGGSGEQVRPGMKVESNFIVGGYMNMGAHGGYPPATTASGSMLNNWLQRFCTPTTGLGHPGWGFLLGGGAYGVNVEGNVFSTAQDNGTDVSGIGFAFSLNDLYQDNTPGYTVQFNRETMNNTIHGNIFDAVIPSLPSGIAMVESQGHSDDGYQLGVPITGTKHTDGAVLTCTPIASASGTPAYQWKYRDASVSSGALQTLGGETASTYTQTATTAGNDTVVECLVTGLTWPTTLGLKGNSIYSNVISQASATTTPRQSVTTAGTYDPPAASDTTYSPANTFYTTVALAATGQSWPDSTRTLKSYLQSLNVTVTSSDGCIEAYNLWTAQRRGNYDTRLVGRQIDTWCRAGRGLGAAP